MKRLAAIQTVDLPTTRTVLLRNVRSLRLHNEDVRSDNNIQKADVTDIFVETRLYLSDKDDTYVLSGFTLYRKDFQDSYIRTCNGTAVYTL